MQRLSWNEIEDALEEDNMGRLPSPPTIEELAAIREAAQKNSAPVGNKLPASLTDAQLAKLRDESLRLGRQLTDDERAICLWGKIPPKMAHGIFVK